ncbi:MAG: hypothetical protein KC417_06095, partial [Myxococcales bacterium]|nr:hypothetical protein [Myxococcales bacterium]
MMRRHTMRVRRSARGRRKQGAVLVMGLLFTLFCVGLMFCILGLEEAVDFREAMQDAADAAALAGAREAGYILLRLPLEIGDLFVEWLEANCPDRA